MAEHTTINLVDREGKVYVIQGVVDEKLGPMLLARQTIAPGLRLVPRSATERDQLVDFLNLFDYEVAEWVVSIQVPIGPRERLVVEAARKGTEAEIRAWADAEAKRQARQHGTPFVRVEVKVEKAE